MHPACVRARVRLANIISKLRSKGVHPACVDAVRNAKKGTTVGEVIAARENPATPADQKKAPRNPNGRKGKSRVDNINSTKGGNDTTYTLRRLARDYPALLDKIEAGELSVNAAAIQAGIRTIQNAWRCIGRR